MEGSSLRTSRNVSKDAIFGRLSTAVVRGAAHKGEAVTNARNNRATLPTNPFDDEAAWRMQCGQRLKQARQAKRMLLRDLAAKNPDEWSVSRISGYESGHRGMTPVIAIDLGQVLGVSAAWLLGVEQTLGYNEDELSLLTLFRAAPPAVRDLVMQMLRMHVPQAN